MFDALFRPKRIELGRKEQLHTLTNDYNGKLQLLQNDSYRKGLVKCKPWDDYITVAEIPYASDSQIDISIKKHKVNELSKYSYIDENQSVEDLTELLSVNLAKVLVDHRFLKAEVKDNKVKFYIRYYKA